MMDSIEGYIENISTAATQIFAKGGPLAELAASLAISVDIVTRQQQEIKRLYKQINNMKKTWTQASIISTMAGGGLMGTVCPHCAEVGRTAPHKNNSCYFDPNKMTDRRVWAQKWMEEKGVVRKDEE